MQSFEICWCQVLAHSCHRITKTQTLLCTSSFKCVCISVCAYTPLYMDLRAYNYTVAPSYGCAYSCWRPHAWIHPYLITALAAWIHIRHIYIALCLHHKWKILLLKTVYGGLLIAEGEWVMLDSWRGNAGPRFFVSNYSSGEKMLTEASAVLPQIDKHSSKKRNL